VRVVNAAGVDQVADRDLIVLGAISRQPLLTKWVENMRMRVDNNRLRVLSDASIDRVYTALDPSGRERSRVDQLLVQQGDALAAMVGMESPLRGGRSVVMITGSQPDNQLTVVNSIRSRDLGGLIQGDLMVASPNPNKPDTPEKVTSFRIGKEYTVGHLGTLVKLRAWVGDSPISLMLLVLIGLLVVALILLWLLNRVRGRRLSRV
jgi:cellulose synthase (UDP-forming)